MRPRNQVALALGLLALLAAGAGILGRRPPVDRDERPSTLVAGPGGSRALLDAVKRLGIPVRRFRLRARELASLAPAAHPLLVILAPSIPFSAPERIAVLAFAGRNDLLLAGKPAEPLMRCFGYEVRRRLADSVAVRIPERVLTRGAPRVRATLVPTRRKVVVDSTRLADVDRISCVVPDNRSVDTLLVSEEGRPVVLRLAPGGGAHRVILVADEELFRNRTLRRTDAGPLMLDLVARGHDQVIFEEYHHGYGAAGSLGGLSLRWSARSPWGWLVWQTVVVGVLALLFGAVRFGVPKEGIGRTRRSPLEHVRALAGALGAAEGHDTAIAAIVRGLRRRLVPPGLRTRGDWRQWLAQLDPAGASERGRAALATLRSITRPGQPPESVLLAANAVEDVWEDLRP